jgi:hypothetical protein
MMQSFRNLFHRGRQSKHRRQSDIPEHLGHVHEDSIIKLNVELWGRFEQNRKKIYSK